MLIALPTPQVLDLLGPDAEAFAQAQFSNDLRELAQNHWQWNAWLSAQGRVRAWFHLLRLDATHLRLVLRGGSAAALRDSLARFVLRAKVRIEVIDSLQLFGTREAVVFGAGVHAPEAWRIERSAQGAALAMPGLPRRWLLLCEKAPPGATVDASDAAINRWRADDVESGIADLSPGLEDRYLPNWLGLDNLGAISVRKGCYPGQEIVARLHFKGGSKRWLYRLAFSGSSALAQPGTPLRSDDDADAGELISAAWADSGRGVALAVLGLVAPGTRLSSAQSVTYEVVAPAAAAASNSV